MFSKINNIFNGNQNNQINYTPYQTQLYNPSSENNFPNSETEEENAKSNKYKNILVGSLLALAAISIPTVDLIDRNDRLDDYNFTEMNNRINEPEEEIICRPELLAKGGKDDKTLERDEFLNLLNFSAMEKLSPHAQNAIKLMASAHYTPVNVNDKEAKEKIIKQVQDIQHMVDYVIDENIKNPSKNYYERLAEYNREYISSIEIIDRVNFNELYRYQKDVSLLKALLRNNTNPIKRQSVDAYEKLEKELNKAQNIVDDITEQYKRYSNIAGNNDFNNKLDKKEFLNLLNLKSLEGVDSDKQKEIISLALEKYQTIIFDKIKDKKAINATNQRITEEVQKAQDIIDNEALQYKLDQLES